MAAGIIQAKAKVIKNIAVAPGCYKISLSSPQLARKAKPGQFVEIKVSNSCELLLRRPFSIHRAKGPAIEIIYEVIGRGSQALSQRKAGEYLDIIGPLGNGFNYQLPITCLAGRQANYQFPILVAGGMGVAPLVFLAEELSKPTTNDERRTTVLIGAKTKKQLLCAQDFRKLGCEVKIATDDGSSGFKGKVTGLLKDLLPITNYQLPITIFACGPRPMLKEISRLAEEYRIPAQVSLEEHMACGFGACLGCVVKTKKGFQRVCKEGPVFSADEIVWE